MSLPRIARDIDIFELSLTNLRACPSYEIILVVKTIMTATKLHLMTLTFSLYFTQVEALSSVI